MLSMKYTGIGSRDTPLEIREIMVEIAMHFQHFGYTLRTGCVSAADKAFATGAGSMKEVYVPWNGWCDQQGVTSVSVASKALAKNIWEQRRTNGWGPFILAHVDEEWDTVHPGTQDLLAKSVCMVLGKDLDVPSDLLICWTKRCTIVGLSAHAIVLAMMSRIPVLNLCDYDTLDIIKKMLRENKDPRTLIEGDLHENRVEIFDS